jgi:RNA polymerase sigma-70 factor (ECF subfamily)
LVQVVSLSFRDFFEAHAPMIWRAVRHLGVAPADVEDVCQEVFIIVHARLPTFEIEGPGDVRTWAFAICMNVVRNYRRRAHRRREISTDVLPDVPQTPLQEELIDRSRAAVRLARLLETLDDDKRVVFVMHDLEGLDMKAIVECLRVPLQTGYSRLRAARQRIEAAIIAEQET